MNQQVKATLITLILTSSIYSLELNLDVKGGLNLATMFGKTVDSLIDNGFDKTPTPAFCGGVGLELQFTERFSLQPELLLSMKGTEFTKKEGDVQEQMDAEYLYLSMPILCKGNFSIGKVGLNPFAGVVPAINIMSDFEMSLEDPNNPDNQYDITVDTKDNIRSTDIGLTAGLELEFPLKKGSILFDVRNTTSLLNTEFKPEVDAYHTVFSFMTGYRFSLRK